MLAEKNIDGSLSNDLTLNMFIQKAQRFCVFQERSIYQTEQKLRTWGANEKTISKVLEHLKDNDFLNQNRFIESFVSGKLKYNKWGKIKIIVELRAHQITDELINECERHSGHWSGATVFSRLLRNRRNQTSNYPLSNRRDHPRLRVGRLCPHRR